MSKASERPRLKERSGRTDGFAIASVVAGLIPIVTFPIVMFVPFVATLPFPGGPRNPGNANVRVLFTLGLISPILALIFGLVARGRSVRSEGNVRGRGLYRAGIVLGVAELALLVVLFVVIAFTNEAIVNPEP
jgi:hypothetical protein